VSSETTLADRRASLEEERATLRRRLTELGFGDLGKLTYDDGFADSGQVTAERGEAEALAITLREALTEVEHALAKIDNGTYGTCERCGQPIADARLEAKPAARLCIDCASQR
jgi:RNA polymerase-binding transcription factor DksA